MYVNLPLNVRLLTRIKIWAMNKLSINQCFSNPKMQEKMLITIKLISWLPTYLERLIRQYNKNTQTPTCTTHTDGKENNKSRTYTQRNYKSGCRFEYCFNGPAWIRYVNTSPAPSNLHVGFLKTQGTSAICALAPRVY